MTKKVSSYLPVVEKHNTFQSHESVNTSSWQAQLFPLRWKKAWPGAQEAVFSKAWTPCSARFQPYQTHVICVPGERLNILVPVCLSFFFLNFSKIWCHLHKLHLFCYFLVIRLAIKSSSNSIYHNVVKCLVRVKWSLPLGLCKYLCFVCSYKPFPSPPSKDNDTQVELVKNCMTLLSCLAEDESAALRFHQFFPLCIRYRQYPYLWGLKNNKKTTVKVILILKLSVTGALVICVL